MTSTSGGDFHIRPATSLADYAFLRRLRNRVRHQMTNDTAKVGYLRQFRFYLSRRDDLHVYVAFVRQYRAGYLILRTMDGHCFITEAVDEPFRRKGVAARMIEFAQTRCNGLTADILLTNTASIRLHETMGFQLVRSDHRMATYRLDTSAHPGGLASTSS